MKGDFTIYKRLLKRAESEAVGGVSAARIRVVDSMDSGDVHELRRNHQLTEDRIEVLASAASTSTDEVREAVAKLADWLRGPSDDLLRQHGITVTDLGDGMEAIEYQEFDVDGYDLSTLPKSLPLFSMKVVE